MPADSIRMFVALRPCDLLAALIGRHKRRLTAAAGPQRYATDPPHTTVYLANFSAAGVERVISAVESAASALEMPAVTIDGWHVFENDPLTGLNTLVCRFTDDSCVRLRRLQLRLLAAVAPLHDAAATQELLLPRWGALSPEQRQGALLFGFPYVGGGWFPHLTIASVRPEQWPHAEQVFNLSSTDVGWDQLAPRAPAPLPRTAVADEANWSSPGGNFTALDVFELHGLEPRLLATFPLVTQQFGKVA